MLEMVAEEEVELFLRPLIDFCYAMLGKDTFYPQTETVHFWF